MKWFSKIAPANIVDTVLVFPVTGHSFIPSDKVFAQIERQICKKDIIINPNYYYDIIKQFATVKKLRIDVDVLYIKGAMQSVLKPCASWNFPISQIKRIYLRRKSSLPNTNIIEMKGVFSIAYYKHRKRL